MKLTLTKKKDPAEKDALVVMILSPSGEKKVTFSVAIGETVDLARLVREQHLECEPEELGYAILGDKRFKGLFKVVESAPSAKKPAVDNGDIKPNAKKAAPVKKLHANKSVTAGSYDNKSSSPAEAG